MSDSNPRMPSSVTPAPLPPAKTPVPSAVKPYGNQPYVSLQLLSELPPKAGASKKTEPEKKGFDVFLVVTEMPGRRIPPIANVDVDSLMKTAQEKTKTEGPLYNVASASLGPTHTGRVSNIVA